MEHKLETHWEHIGNTNMNTIGNMWGNETHKLFSQLLSTPLGPLCMGHELPTMPQSSKTYLITLKMPKFQKILFKLISFHEFHGVMCN